MTTRRNFLIGSGAAVTGLAMASRAATGNRNTLPLNELESRIVRRDFRDITRDMLPTPCLVVDKDLFDRNLKLMADDTKKNGIAIRPHVKVNKSVDVAKIQVAHVAIGLTTATIAEAELMSTSGLKNVLWTKQPASKNAISRAIALSKKDPTFMFVIEDSQVFDWLEQAAQAESGHVRVLVAVFAGLKRQGIDNGQPALELAQKIASSKRMSFEGIMAYAGAAAHTRGWEQRKAKSASDMAGPNETVALCKKSGLPVNYFSGGSTGTYNIDHTVGLTELEVGSYVFMDTRYFPIGSKNGDTTYTDFTPAMTVSTTVDSRLHPQLAIVDYGNKAGIRATDIVRGKPWVKVAVQGAEYGGLTWQDADKDIKLGDRIEIICTVLDDSTNYYDRYYVAQGDKIVDAWPIMGRSGAAQR